MSPGREPSYYEVALTHRQVMAVFVVLLGLMVVAFFAGVWVGREEVPVAGETVAAAAEPAPAEGEGEEGPPVYRFFSDQEAELPPDAVGNPETTLAEDLSGGGAAAGEPQAGAPSGGTRPAPQPAAADEPADSRQPAQRPAATTPRETRPAAQQPAPSRPAAQPAAGQSEQEGLWAVQVLSSRDQAAAREVLQKLLDGGYPASLSTIEQPGRIMYRVRIGPYDSRGAAEKAAGEVNQRYKLDTWIAPI